MINEEDVLNYDLISQNTYDSYFEEDKEIKHEIPFKPFKTKTVKSKTSKVSKNVKERSPEEIEIFQQEEV